MVVVDVDEKNIAQVMKDGGKETAGPKVFYDYRKMLDEGHKDLDVVLIATPDHNHGPAAIRAINYGKHVFCQKPLADNIAESVVSCLACEQPAAARAPSSAAATRASAAPVRTRDAPAALDRLRLIIVTLTWSAAAPR